MRRYLGMQFSSILSPSLTEEKILPVPCKSFYSGQIKNGLQFILPKREKRKGAAALPGHLGSVTVKRLPSPSRLSTQIAPPWARTIALAMVRPMPTPPVLRLRERSVR